MFAGGNSGVRMISWVTKQSCDMYKKRRDMKVNYR